MNFQKIIRNQREKKFFSIIPAEKDLECKHQVSSLSPGEGYFQLRLSEMFLRDRRVYWNGYIPMLIALSEFSYAGKNISVPIYIGNNLLESIGNDLNQEEVEYYNTNILGPTPYLGGDLAFFLGLFQVQVSDLSLGLFSFVENLIGTFSIGQLGSYLKIAKSIKTGLSGLIGFKEVQMKIGNRTVFTAIENDPNQLREGYLLYINCPWDRVEPNQFQIKKDRLYGGNSEEKLEPYDAHDYCLVKVLCLSKRSDYSVLGFSDIYDQAITQIYKNHKKKADQIFQSLIQKISISPDLTQADRFGLIQVYCGNYEKQWEFFLKTQKRLTTSHPAVRGSIKSLNAPDTIKTMAFMANKNHMPRDIETGLLDIGKNMDQILGTPEPKGKLSDQDLNRQLEVLSSVSQVKKMIPGDLVKAISNAHEMN